MDPVNQKSDFSSHRPANPGSTPPLASLPSFTVTFLKSHLGSRVQRSGGRRWHPTAGVQILTPR